MEVALLQRCDGCCLTSVLTCIITLQGPLQGVNSLIYIRALRATLNRIDYSYNSMSLPTSQLMSFVIPAQLTLLTPFTFTIGQRRNRSACFKAYKTSQEQYKGLRKALSKLLPNTIRKPRSSKKQQKPQRAPKTSFRCIICSVPSVEKTNICYLI